MLYQLLVTGAKSLWSHIRSIISPLLPATDASPDVMSGVHYNHPGIISSESQEAILPQHRGPDPTITEVDSIVVGVPSNLPATKAKRLKSSYERLISVISKGRSDDQQVEKGRHKNLCGVTLSAFTDGDPLQSSIKVPKQRAYPGSKHVIPSSLADTRCTELGVNGLLDKLNTTLGTAYTLKAPSLYSVLQTCISNDYDFGVAYGRLRPIWYSVNQTTIGDELCTRELKDQKMRQEALVDNRIVNPDMPPRRVWDLYSNRVVPYWVVSDKEPWAISYAWTDPPHRINVLTPINANEWRVPMHKDGNLDLVRIELLNLGAEYVWLDILCLRRYDSQEPEEKERLRKEEWKLDVPTSGYVYHHTEMVVYYFCGLGGAFSLTMDDFDNPRFWLNRAWTFQEISKSWIIAGSTDDVTLTATSIDEAGEHGPVVSRLFRELQSLAQIVHRVDNVLDLLLHIRGRGSENGVDKVTALVYPLRSKTIPTYDEEQHEEDAWAGLVATMSQQNRGQLFFLYPETGTGAKKWGPHWEQVSSTGTHLPTGREDLCEPVERDDEADADWYHGMCIEEGWVRGLAVGDLSSADRWGEMVTQDANGISHTFKIVAPHQSPIPEDAYTLISSGAQQTLGKYWVAGRRLGGQEFEKVSIFRMTDEREITRLMDMGIANKTRNLLI
ncbi:hypothetical protein ARMGADRAFT_1085068 [Armillaria gallica]|uniref:Heterokaryon incompatibility domain-containing protein n=1 Tax=Armillaria gallica TaxID=47427 RepID=A0A2H3CYJ9_ARMGA|nr:hypothetical protein ARMGADRAFT_1085068 [Armillaria gallica]